MNYITNYNFDMQFGISNRQQLVSNLQNSVQSNCDRGPCLYECPWHTGSTKNGISLGFF